MNIIDAAVLGGEKVVMCTRILLTTCLPLEMHQNGYFGTVISEFGSDGYFYFVTSLPFSNLAQSTLAKSAKATLIVE